MKLARGFLDTLVRAISNRSEVRDLDEPGRLRLEVVQLYEEGLFHEAEETARRLVELQRESVGEEHPEFASSLSNLALLLQKQGDCPGAEPLLRQTLEIRRATLGEDHPDYATSLNNLALLLCERHDLDAAEPLLRQALEIRRVALGEHHPDYATGLISLALLLCERHDLDAAEPLLRQALEIRRATLGEDHPDYATSLNNLALLLCERHDLDAAEPLLRQALEIRRVALGEHHPDTESSDGSLSVLLAQKARVGGPAQEPPAPPPIPQRAGTAEPAAGRDRDEGRSPRAVAGEETGTPEPLATDPVGGPASGRHAAVLTAELTALTRAFVEASEGLLQEAARMQDPGLPPDLVALSAASTCRRQFVGLRAAALGLAATLGVRSPAPERVAGLPDLARLLEAVSLAEIHWAKQVQVRDRALDLLSEVLSFVCRDAEDQPYLDACQAQARTLHAAIASCLASELPHEAERLAGEAHPLASLLILVHDRGDVNGESWADHYAETLAAFGKPLAVAAARGRIVPAAVPPPPAAGPPEPGPEPELAAEAATPRTAGSPPSLTPREAS